MDSSGKILHYPVILCVTNWNDCTKIVRGGGRYLARWKVWSEVTFSNFSTSFPFQSITNKIRKGALISNELKKISIKSFTGHVVWTKFKEDADMSYFTVSESGPEGRGILRLDLTPLWPNYTLKGGRNYVIIIKCSPIHYITNHPIPPTLGLNPFL